MSRFSGLVSQLLANLCKQQSAVSSEVRQAILKRAAAAGGTVLDEGGAVPAELEELVDKIARHAYRVTDEDYARLREVGYSEDQLFAVTLSAATGAATARLQRGLAVLHEAPAPPSELQENSEGQGRESEIRSLKPGKVNVNASRGR
jgi:hypothetical protein